MREITRKEFLRRVGAGAVVGTTLLGTGCITTKATDTTGLTPAAGQTLLGPRLKASTFDTGVGILIKHDNVTVVNPRIEDFSRGVEVVPKTDGTPPRNIRIIFDANARGTAEAGIFHCRTAVRAQRFDGLEIGSVTPGSHLALRENYRNIMFHGGTNGRVHHCEIIGPDYVFPKANDGNAGSIVGIKGLHTPAHGPPYETSNISIDNNVVARVFEEGISFDPGNDAEKPVKEQDKVAVVSMADGYVDLANARWEGVGNLRGGYYMAFTDGPAAGHVLKITRQAGKRFYLADPDGILASVRVGNIAITLMPYLHVDVMNNRVDATGSLTGIAHAGGSFFSRVEGNRVFGRGKHDSYDDSYGLRRDADGRSVPQSIRVSSIVGYSVHSGVGTDRLRNPAAMHSVVNNFCDWDISLHVIRWVSHLPTYSTPNYWAGNTFSGSGQLWVKDHVYSPPLPDKER